VVRQNNETATEALGRHAKARQWREATLYRWKRRLQEAQLKEAESAFNDIGRLNKWLKGFGLEEQKSVKVAHTLLRTVYINIFDLLEDRFDRAKSSLAALRSYTQKRRLFYPLKLAKSEGLRDFLRPLS